MRVCVHMRVHVRVVCVVKDGQMRRISNWNELSESERAATQAKVAKRNKKRLDKLTASTHTSTDINMDSAIEMDGDSDRHSGGRDEL